MNDQWSGKILFSERRAKLAAPNRSSNHLKIRRIISRPRLSRPVAPVPEPRTDRPREVASSAQVPRPVRVDVELGEGPRGGTEHHLRAVGHVERGLVARTLELV